MTATLDQGMRCLCLFATLSVLVISSVAAEDSIVAPDAEVVKLAGGMKFTEGPVWLPKANKLVFSDIPNSKLMEWSADGGLAVFRDSENANGNIIDLEGRIISCQHSGRNLIRIDGGEATVLVDKFDGKRFNSPNDVAIRHDGTLWFTDPPWGLWGSGAEAEVPGHWVYKFDPRTKKTEAIVKDLAMPNGIVFSPDETRVYIADTGGHPRHPDPQKRKLPGGIHCYGVREDGSLGAKQFTIPQGSDGMAVDVKGNIYTTHGDAVTVYDTDGKKLTAIKTPENPANVCFGGKDFKTLFITARTSLYSIELQIAGDKPGK